MNLSQFEDSVDRHGGDIGRWPLHLREAAADLIAKSAVARTVLAAMAEVESELRAFRPRSDATANAVAARAVGYPQLLPMRRAVRRAAFATAAAATLLIGLVVGNIWPQHDGGPDRLMSAAFNSMETGDVE